MIRPLPTALALALLCCPAARADQASPVPSSPGPLTPEQMYLRSMKAMKAEPIPPYVQFREAVKARNIKVDCNEHGATISLKHGDIERVSLVSYRSQDGEAVSVEQSTGKRCGFSFLFPAGSSLETLDTATPAPTADESGMQDDSGMRLAGAVRVESAKYYKIALAGTQTIDGHPVFHLTLKPYRNPLDHPLTDLWVDTNSYLVRQARGEASAHFIVGSARFEGTLGYDRVGGYWIVTSEDFSAAANALLMHVRTHLAAAGSDFSFPADLPGVFPPPSPSPSPKPQASPNR